MLHCTMGTFSAPLQVGLEDLLGDMVHARRTGDVGRLALLAYCEVRRWARQAGETGLAERSTELITLQPSPSRAQFLAHIDDLIDELEAAHARSSDQSLPV
jgi:hypothetical protein